VFIGARFHCPFPGPRSVVNQRVPHRYLARLYCAEALLHLGESTQALELLSPAALTALGAPFTDFGGMLINARQKRLGSNGSD
jgi:hypothetical protein